MKVYFLDFWFVLFIKIFRRIQPLKNRNTELSDDTIENGAIMCSLYSGAYLAATIVMFVKNIFLDSSVSKDYLLGLTMGIVFLLWVLIYFRYVRGFKWKMIESIIDSQYSSRYRDLLFTIMAFLFLLYHSIFTAIFFAVIVPK